MNTISHLFKRALVRGEVKGRKLIIGGTVEGNLFAHELVEIKSKGRVLGDIFTQKLTVSEGVEYNGRIEMKRHDAKVVDLQPKGQKA